MKSPTMRTTLPSPLFLGRPGSGRLRWWGCGGTGRRACRQARLTRAADRTPATTAKWPAPLGRMAHRDPGFHHQAGPGFRVGGVLVDPPHFHAWRDALQELMDIEWADLRGQTSYSPERSPRPCTSRVIAGRPQRSPRQSTSACPVPTAGPRSTRRSSRNTSSRSSKRERSRRSKTRSGLSSR